MICSARRQKHLDVLKMHFEGWQGFLGEAANLVIVRLAGIGTEQRHGFHMGVGLQGDTRVALSDDVEGAS